MKTVKRRNIKLCLLQNEENEVQTKHMTADLWNEDYIRRNIKLNWPVEHGK